MTHARFQFGPPSPRRALRAQTGCVRHAVSLLETGIAIGILGIGLIMIAAIFPVALTQHRDSAERAQALDMVSKAEAMLHNRLSADHLWFDQAFLAAGVDSHWHLIPFANLEVGGSWVDLTRYVALSNLRDPAFLPPDPYSELQLFGTDVLSDRITPFNDAGAQEIPNRLVWYGFYRKLANGTHRFAAAVCKQRRNQSYFKQDFSVPFPTLNPTELSSEPQRLPVPWRVTLARFSAAPLANAVYIPGDSSALRRLAPPGSKIMIHGHTCADAAPIPTAPAGRILTVAYPVENGDGVFGVQVLEDIWDIASNDPADAGDNNFGFDVWLFPPADNGTDSPMLEWKVSL